MWILIQTDMSPSQRSKNLKAEHVTLTKAQLEKEVEGYLRFDQWVSTQQINSSPSVGRLIYCQFTLLSFVVDIEIINDYILFF